MNPVCPYCGEKSELVGGEVIYPHRPDLHHLRFYLCKPCDARVCCHDGTTKPMGRLGNAALRYYRKRAHQHFDPLWKNKSAKMTRTEAYAWLSLVLGIPEEECHIAMFDEETCKEVERVARNKRGLDMKIPKR